MITEDTASPTAVLVVCKHYQRIFSGLASALESGSVRLGVTGARQLAGASVDSAVSARERAVLARLAALANPMNRIATSTSWSATSNQQSSSAAMDELARCLATYVLRCADLIRIYQRGYVAELKRLGVKLRASGAAGRTDHESAERNCELVKLVRDVLERVVKCARKRLTEWRESGIKLAEKKATSRPSSKRKAAAGEENGAQVQKVKTEKAAGGSNGVEERAKQRATAAISKDWRAFAELNSAIGTLENAVFQLAALMRIDVFSGSGSIAAYQDFNKAPRGLKMQMEGDDDKDGDDDYE